MNDSDYDIVAVTETFLDENISDPHLALAAYNFFRQDRIGFEGGGVAFYARKSFTVKILASSNYVFNNAPEYIIAEIKKSLSELLFAVVYRRPPGLSPHHCFELLATYTPNYNFTIVTGDFNADLISDTNTDARTLKHLVDAHSMKVVSLEPTCHHLGPQTSHTTLNLFLVNFDMNIASFSQSASPFIYYHDSISMAFDFPVNLETSSSFLSRRLDKVNMSALNALIILFFQGYGLRDCSLKSDIPPTAPAQSTDAHEKLLTTAISSAFDILAPIRQITLSSKEKPWVSSTIRIHVRAPDAAYKRAKITTISTDIARYKSLRRQVANELDTAKKTYIA